MGILAWIAFGFFAGAVAKLLLPGRDPGGFIVTILIGIAGAVVGGFVASHFGYGGIARFDLRSFFVAVGGAMLLLFLFRLMRG